MGHLKSYNQVVAVKTAKGRSNVDKF